MRRLQQLRTTLLKGMRLSKQSAYGRRAPQPEAISVLNAARSGLRDLVEDRPNCAEGWRLLAQAEECFLDYKRARECLERAMSLTGTRTNSDLRRLALYKEKEREWNELRLTPAQLRSLGEYLREVLITNPRSERFKWTEHWLVENGIKDRAAVIESIRAKGAFDDFQVAENLARG